MNRCSNESYPRTFCPKCKKHTANSNHLSIHEGVDEARLRAYVQGLFTAGLRGPLHQETLMDTIWEAAQESRAAMEAVVQNALAVVGVGLAKNKAESMPLYDTDNVFNIGYVSENITAECGVCV